MRRPLSPWWLLAAALFAFSCARTGAHPGIVQPSLPLSSEETLAAPAQTGSFPVPPATAPDYQGQREERTGEKQHQTVEIDDIIDARLAPSVLWGVSVRSLSTGQSLLTRNSDKLLTPASNMKLLTTAVALTRLGPDFRYTSGLYWKGKRKKNVLEGDVFFRGSGDPTISERFQGKATAVFEGWADALKRHGVREISGDLVGDDTLFDDRSLGTGWAWDDEMIAYSARISALSFNDNCFEATVRPGKNVGDPARISISPETAYVELTNALKTSSTDEQSELEARRLFGSNRIVLSGRIGLSSEPRHLRFSVANPALYAVTVLKEVFEASGIRVRGRAMDMGHSGKPVPDYGAMTEIAVRQSEPLSEIIEQVNKRSQNLYAELLFRTLGASFRGRGTTKNSADVVVESLAAMGIPKDSLAVYDGSGLSRLDLVAPDQVVQVLDYMSRHPYFEYYYRSLPVAGVDGTLMKRMRNTPAEDNVRAKTGTLTHVTALSGYVRDREGSLLAFSIMSNNSLRPASEMRTLEDAICERLVRATEGQR
ncbi:MAG TPA: D-alanyl-D-alanine carboxypeptidase/D-alanyl-D-alanine-endopeptidase [Syntrophorhabdales bacterium]|nr:D-alanyl-D-alanine carboxypeptidase/D-alanyl-D-alanine-endopeptidase [Syntrophorhabdales bacterium]